MEARRYGVVAVIAAAACALVLVGLLVRVAGRDSVPDTWVNVASVDGLEREHVIFAAGVRAYVVATDDGPLALYARSPQLGERVVYCRSSGGFEDPAHGSKFDSVGRYVLGPAPRGLDRFDVHVVDGDVWVDPTNITLGPPRGAHDPQRAVSFCFGHD